MTIDIFDLQTWTSPSLVLAVLVTLLTLWFLYTWLQDNAPKNLPPGPRGLGAIYKFLKGNLNGELPTYATEWYKEYGPLVYLHVLGQRVLFMGSHEVNRTLLASDEFKMITADRAPTSVTDFMWSKKDMIFAPYDARVKKQRRLLHNVMGVFGNGVEKFESLVLGEFSLMVEDFKANIDKEVQMNEVIGRRLKNILFTLLFGRRPESDAECNVLIENDTQINKLLSLQNMMAVEMFPFLFWIPNKFRTDARKYRSTRKEMKKLFNEHKRTYQPGKIRGMLDTLFEAQGKAGNEWMDDESVFVYASLLVFAGNITTKSLLTTCFMFLLNHPDVVKKIQDEIDRVIGDRPPRVEDRLDMHYTEAVSLETLRTYVGIPLQSDRVIREDIHYKGYVIPKHTVLIANTEAIHHDPKEYDDPWTFRPERLLDERGIILPADHPERKRLQSFGAGIRVCPGEVFARSRAFLFIVHMLQNFDLLPPDSEPMIKEGCLDFDRNSEGIVRIPSPYKLKLRLRTPAKQ